MDKRDSVNIILIGFSTTGKSETGSRVARQLGWDLVDTDEEIVRLADKSIARIFAEEGEEPFRKLERQVLTKVCEREKVVISTGGGVILDPGNRELMKKRGVVICLEASPETIHQRLLKDKESSASPRPLLEVADPLKRIKEMKEYRQPYYAVADWTVHTDELSLEEVCQEVIRGWYYCSRRNTPTKSDLACEVTTLTDRYPVFVGWGLLDSLGDKLSQVGLKGNAHLISDENVFSHYGKMVMGSLEKAGFTASSLVIPPGEGTKSLNATARIYDWLAERRTERGDMIIALGGGMVGDLAGFAAATFLRGLSLVQVPTSLVGMVDASIGGKTAVNHPQAKNIIGAFYQPRCVIADVQTLTTLPRRELVSGWAEVIKYGLILDSDYFEFLEQNIDELKNLDPEVTTAAIKRCAVIKAQVVSEDEREQGKRTLLNYGHTIAHGLEAATDYGRLLHGEAVAVGMTGAAILSLNSGLLSAETVERQRLLLEDLGLTTCCSDVNLEAVLRAIELDKKVKGKKLRWVLLTEIGKSVIRDDVSSDMVSDVVKELLSCSKSSNRGTS
ncbi:3-dehydroquinate synthase [Chloroflexota bacterium]